jgi:clan AA aspartic protease (TIGR02281 family)
MYQLYLYRANKNYEQAILCTEKIKELDADPYFDAILSSLYQDMGDFASALPYAQAAYISDSTETDYISQLASIYSDLDSLEQCIKIYNAYIAQYPESNAAYHMRAQTHFFAGNYTSAIEDYTTAITLDTKDTYARYMLGRAHYIMGDTLKANKDFQRVVDDTKNSVETAFAYIFLGQNEEAKHLADSILLADSVEHENRYNIACCYSMLGDIEMAFTLLEEELKDGYVGFTHIRRDPDFAPLRGERLDSLLSMYETKAQERIRAFKGENTSESTTERIVEIPFTKSGGVTKVDCTINNLPLIFIFDTGASDVTISQVEANFMYKNGYLDSRDVVGKKTYQVATGAIAVGTTIILKEIKFGGLILRDVRASVVESQNAPLLLGQTILQRLGKIEIDNTQRILKITTNQ